METFGEIGGTAKSHPVSHLGYGQIRFFQQIHRLPQPDLGDQAAGRFPDDRFDPAVKVGASHAQLTGQLGDTELIVLQVLLNDSDGFLK